MDLRMKPSQQVINVSRIDKQQDSLRSISRFQAWMMASRPKTLPAALAPVLVGTALAIQDGVFAWLPALVAAMGALLLQIGSNFANDYFDFFKGADTPDRLGPVRVTASGLISPGDLRWGMVVVFGLAALVGLYLVAVGGWPIVAIGVASILAALLYTGGPLPFGYYGLGDLFVFIFFGLVAVCGTYYVQALDLHIWIVIASIPVGALVTAILVVNNLRDIDTDRRAGKYTLAVRLGRTGTRVEYLLLLLVAYALPLILWQIYGYHWLVLLPWLTLPLAFRLLRTIWREQGAVLNKALAGTAQLALFFSLLFAIGLVF
jgi:1,4-dihydroxy-2-naphthoate polyprenyltransferase